MFCVGVVFVVVLVVVVVGIVIVFIAFFCCWNLPVAIRSLVPFVLRIAVTIEAVCAAVFAETPRDFVLQGSQLGSLSEAGPIRSPPFPLKCECSKNTTTTKGRSERKHGLRSFLQFLCFSKIAKHIKF
jgi:hypothetical protein